MLNCLNSQVSGHIHRLRIALGYVGSRDYQTYSIAVFIYRMWLGRYRPHLCQEFCCPPDEGIAVTTCILVNTKRPRSLGWREVSFHGEIRLWWAERTRRNFLLKSYSFSASTALTVQRRPGWAGILCMKYGNSEMENSWWLEWSRPLKSLLGEKLGGVLGMAPEHQSELLLWRSVTSAGMHSWTWCHIQAKWCSWRRGGLSGVTGPFLGT